MQIIAGIIALSKTIKIFDEWLQLLTVAYSQAKYSSMKKENKDAIKKAIEHHDQRDLETAMGSTMSGLPSGVPGSEIVDHLPGVD